MAATSSLDFLNSPAFTLFLKTATLIILVIYTIFALMIVRQVDLMSKTLITSVAPVIKFISIIQVFVAVGLIILSWVIL